MGICDAGKTQLVAADDKEELVLKKGNEMAKYTSSLNSHSVSANNDAVILTDEDIDRLTNLLFLSDETVSIGEKLSAVNKLKNSASKLSSLEESKLISIMRSSPVGSDAWKRAHSRLFQSVYVDAFTIALQKSRKNSALDKHELTSYGVMGAMEAFSKYDSSKTNGGKFSTYAHSFIISAISEACGQMSNVMPLSRARMRRIKKLQKVKAEFKLAHGREPSVSELHNLLPDYSKKYIEAHMNGGFWIVSLEEPVTLATSDNKSTYQDHYDNTHHAESFVDDIVKNERVALLYDSLNRLDKRTQEVINYRYGLGGKPKMKLEELGKKLSMSTQSISRIENDGLIQLRALMTTPQSVA